MQVQVQVVLFVGGGGHWRAGLYSLLLAGGVAIYK